MHKKQFVIPLQVLSIIIACVKYLLFALHPKIIPKRMDFFYRPLALHMGQLSLNEFSIISH